MNQKLAIAPNDALHLLIDTQLKNIFSIFFSPSYCHLYLYIQPINPASLIIINSIFQNHHHPPHMFKIKTQPSSPTSHSIPISQFKQRAGNLLTKIEGIHTEIEENKLSKFKQLLLEIVNVQEKVDEEVKEQRGLYQGLLAKIKGLCEDVEEEVHVSEKTAVLVKNRMEAFSKANEKAFQKLKLQRLQTQQRLQKYLDQKLQSFLKKYPQLTNPSPSSPPAPPSLLTHHQQLQSVRTQIAQYFNTHQLEQQKLKQQIYSAIEQCTQIINQNNKEINDVQVQSIQYMRIIQLEIQSRIGKIGEERGKMEEEVLGLLERVVGVVSQGVDGDGLGYGRDFRKGFGRNQ